MDLQDFWVVPVGWDVEFYRFGMQGFNLAMLQDCRCDGALTLGP